MSLPPFALSRSVPSTHVKFMPSSDQLVQDVPSMYFLITVCVHVALNLGGVISHQSQPRPGRRPAHTDTEMVGGGSDVALMDGGRVGLLSSVECSI